MTNKTKQTMLIVMLCVLVFLLILTVNAIAHAESLDTAEVTELRIATTDCAYTCLLYTSMNRYQAFLHLPFYTSFLRRSRFILNGFQ